MKSWLTDVEYDYRLDYCLEPDDHYINKVVENVLTPYDLMIARSRWEKRNKIKNKLRGVTF